MHQKIQKRCAEVIHKMFAILEITKPLAEQNVSFNICLNISTIDKKDFSFSASSSKKDQDIPGLEKYLNVELVTFPQPVLIV